jgi:protein arginine N-methyltransferase 1
MYSVSSYGAMIADKVRMDCYVRALEQTIKPNSIVVDIGTGTGVFALVACRLGARRVYAIEPSDAIQVGRESAVANGCADKIEWIQDLSTQVTLPERANVIVSDLRGSLPLYDHHLTAIVDARLRLLAPGGIMIPQEDTLWLCPVEAPESYASYKMPWLENPFHFDLTAGYRRAINSWGKVRVPRERFLSAPTRWAILNYRTVKSPDVSAQVSCVASRSGTAHGMSLWFEAMLTDGIQFSTAPDLPELVYGSAFLPWMEPVELSVDDRIAITLDANLVGNQYIWRWQTEVLDHRNESVKARFRQSTFFGVPLSPVQMRKRAADFRPELNEDGRVVKRVLDLMACSTALEEIATQLTDEFPGRFARPADALARVGELSIKYSESAPQKGIPR